MRIAMLGTRGVPARYGGFETAVEEVGLRLAARGHHVVVYCREGKEGLTEHLGMELVQLPAVHRKAFETLNHTVTAALKVRATEPFDAILLFNAANAVVLPLLGSAAKRVAIHVDGLEWKRDKWGRVGKSWYLAMERYGASHAAALIADAKAIQDYYLDRYDKGSHFIPYGAPLILKGSPVHLDGLGLASGEFDLVVARHEPENHVEIPMRARYLSDSDRPLVVVGSVPYESAYTEELDRLAKNHASIMMLGSVWDAEVLDELFAHCRTYIHGHSVGGTNPALLRAMGAGCPVMAYDVVFNREVLGRTGLYFSTPSDLASLLRRVDEDPDGWRASGFHAQARAAELYDWDRVADDYEGLCVTLSRRGPRRSR